MNIAAIIILYHPDTEVIDNILSYSNHMHKIYVFDNTSGENTIQEQLTDIPGLHFFHDGENRGIPERLNTGCKMAIADGYEWVLTMDQDTSFHPQAIVNYLTCFNNYVGKESIAAFGIKYSRFPEQPNAECIAEDVEDVITSGMLLNLLVWQKNGGFDEALFIDSVDQEYCIRSGMMGYKTIRFANVEIQHKIGTLVNRASIKSLYTVRKKKEIHSPLRCYYMYRNMLYIENKYKESNPEFSKAIRKNVETHMKVCQYYGRETKALKRYIKQAKEDFADNHMGKISTEKLVK